MMRATLLLGVIASCSAFVAPRQAPEPMMRRKNVAASEDVSEAPADPRLVISDVPGMMELDEMTLAKQASDLDALSSRWQRQKDLREWEESRLTGFSEQAEIINGRVAMFFLVVGLLTELWTGQSIPDQVVTMARVGGFISL